MKNILLALSFILISFAVDAQKDTISIVQYNLLNYGSASRTTAYKNARLSTILGFAQPDIFGVNEISNNPANAQTILDSVLGSGWSKGNYINTNNETQYNCLFWNNRRFGLRNQFSISSNLRDIIAYQLYYRPDSGIVGDTVSFTVIVAHLKASNTSQDAASRAAETQTVVNYLNNRGHGGNYIFMGDLNVYSSSEACYQNLVANPVTYARLYDPINRPGNWNANSSFSDIHTQATRTTQLSDGGATGGLDDRFDQILVSGYIMGDSAGMMYVPGTYKAVGQDGNHYNKAVNDAPANTSVTATVAQALYEMSDHLPVTARFAMDRRRASTGVPELYAAERPAVVNPFTQSIRVIMPDSWLHQPAAYNLLTIDGRTVQEGILIPTNKQTDILSGGALPSGIYILMLRQPGGQPFVSRLVHY